MQNKTLAKTLTALLVAAAFLLQPAAGTVSAGGASVSPAAVLEEITDSGITGEDANEPDYSVSAPEGEDTGEDPVSVPDEIPGGEGEGDESLPETSEPESSDGGQSQGENNSQSEHEADAGLSESNTENNSAASRPANSGAGGIADTAPQRDEPIVPFVDQNIRDYFDQLGYESNSILEQFLLSFTDSDGNPVTEPTVGSNVHMEFPFHIPANVTALLGQGDYFQFYLPDELTLAGFVDGPLSINGIEYGNFTVDTNGLVTITFNDNASSLGEINGNIILDGFFNEDYIPGPGDIIITIPDEDDLSVTVTIKPEVESTIEKNGYFDKTPNPSQIIWNVDINKALDELTGVTVTENFPAGTTYQSVEIYRVDVDNYGVPIEGSETLVDPSLYTVDENGNVTFSDELEPITDCYRLVYTTSIDDDAKPAAGGNVPFTNGATLSTNETADIGTSSTVTAGYGRKLNKVSDNYDPINQNFSWTVHYNHNETTIAPGTGLITDTFQNGGMSLVEGSISINTVTLNSNGTETPGPALVEGIDYEIVPTANGFEVVFLREISEAIDIHYVTHAEGILDQNQAFYNRVEDEDGNTSGSGVTADQQGVIKNRVAVDAENEIITWRILVNRNHYEMYNWSLTDVLSPGLTLIVDSVQVYDTGTADSPTRTLLTDAPGDDYVLVDASPQFNITLGSNWNPTDHSFEIVYQTRYDPTDLGENPNFSNTANSTWDDGDGNSHGSSDTDSYNPTQPERNNGTKYGSYNAVTKEITWSILVDYTNSGLQNAYIEDEIIPVQTFVEGSGKVYTYEVRPNGQTVRGPEITGDDLAGFTLIEPTEADPHYYVYLPDAVPGSGTGQYWFEYKTSLDGTVIQDTYYNTVYFHNDLTPDYSLDADVSVTNGGEVIGKDGGREQDGWVWWEITVNASQSTLQDVVVVDTPSTNQLIDMDSLVVYGTNVSTGGVVTINTSDVLTEGEDYTATYAQNEDGVYELTVRFLNEIDRPYMIRYRVRIIVEEGQSNTDLRNDVTITGNNVVTIPGEDEVVINVNVSGGQGIIEGTLGAIGLVKSGSDGALLEGAVFQLYDDTGEPYGGTFTSGAGGVVNIGNLVYGTYTIVEVAAPDGYSIPEELREGNGVTLTVDENSSGAGATPVPLVNPQSEVTLRKADPALVAPDDGLTGAEFALYRLDTATGEYVRIRADESFVTGADGTLTILGLLEGSYRLVELTAPAGYRPDYTPIDFALARDEDGALTYDVGDVANIPTLVTLTKQDPDGILLPETTFILEQLDEGTGAWTRIREDEDLTTGNDGVLTVEGLAIGTYRFTEVAAPDGYTLVLEPLVFSVALDDNGLLLPLALTFVNPPTSVTLIKENPDGAPLAGAVFVLEAFDIDTEEWSLLTGRGPYTSDENGTFEVLRLTPGLYRFRETGAPLGYSLLEEPIEFALTVAEDGTIPAVTVGPVVNQPSLVTLPKVDETGASLPGAEFALEQYSAGTGEWNRILRDTPLVSDANGFVTLAALPVGQYRFVEISAPDGYQLTAETRVFEILADENGELQPVVLEALANIPVPTPPPSSSPASSSSAATGTVSTGDGSTLWIWLVLLVAAAASLGLFYAVARRGRE